MPEDIQLPFPMGNQSKGSIESTLFRILQASKFKIENSAVFQQQNFTGNGNTVINWNAGNKIFFTFGAQNETFTFENPVSACNLILVLKQDSIGNRTITWPSSVKWPAGTAPTLSTGANAIDIIAFYFDGTNYYGNSSLNFG